MGKTKTAFVSGAPEEPEKPKKAAKEKPFDKARGKPEKVHIAGLKGGQRIKTIEGGPVVTEAPEEEKASGPEGLKARGEKKAGKPKIRGKKYQEAKAKVDRNKLYPLADAIKLVKETSYSKFDGAVELHLNVKKAGLSAKLVLPHSGGKEKKVEVASDTTIEKLKAGKIDFDILLATADMMPKLVPFAKVLGPRGLMPNPKNETIIKDRKAAEKFSASSVTLKTQKDFPIIHTVVGKVSQSDTELIENAQAVIEAINAKQINTVFIKPSMGPSIKLAIS